MTRSPTSPRRIFMLGATGTIGRATVKALAARGHEVVCFVRPGRAVPAAALPARVSLRTGDVTSAASLSREGLCGETFDVLLSCMASRNGAPADAWAIDHRAHSLALQAARAAGVRQVVQLSAICVQKPLLVFQRAKLAYEQELMASGLDWSIVRPTAFFKSLSGQVARVQQGRPFLVFGSGELTACKPLADDDLADFLADCVHDLSRRNRVLPIGGPGPAITPLQQAHMLFDLLQRPPRIRHVPLALMDGICGTLGLAARVLPALQAKAEFARIGRYYATESMLVWDEAAGRYDADATPSTGTRTLREHYAALLQGRAQHERGEHAVF